MSEQAPLLQAEGPTKVFGSGRTLVRAVDGVDLTAEAGEVVLIMGPSGSGKTTLLTMLGGLLRPTAGRALIDGLEVTALGSRELPRVRRHHVGFVFQTFNLLEALTAQENVEVALNVAGVSGAPAHARAGELLAGAGLEGRVDFRVCDLSGASASASRSPAPSPTGPVCCSPTSRPRTSTRATAAR